MPRPAAIGNFAGRTDRTERGPARGAKRTAIAPSAARCGVDGGTTARQCLRIASVPEGIRPMTPEVNVLALVKGQERYVYVYDDVSQKELIDAFRNHAADPGLSLSWFDAT